MNEYRDIIKTPVITEKATDAKNENKYVFKVDYKANKTQVKQAIEKIFKVKVLKVNILNGKPKIKRVGNVLGKTNRYRKAMVTLAPDNKIEIN